MEEIHKKKCEYCGMLYDESNDINLLLIKGPAKCPYCKAIDDLKDFLSDNASVHKKELHLDPIYQRNFIEDGNKFFPNVTSYTLAEHETTYEIVGRTKKVQDVINRIEYIRKFLLTDIGPQFEILDSIYENKNIFWNEGGNLVYYVNNTSIQFIVIKLKEILSGSNSKYSIDKIKNILIANPKCYFENHKVYEVIKFKNSGDVVKEEFKKFPILDYLDTITSINQSYRVRFPIDFISSICYNTRNVKSVTKKWINSMK